MNSELDAAEGITLLFDLTMKQLIIFALSVLFVACGEKKGEPVKLQADHQTFSTPAVIVEAIDEIVSGLTEEEKKAIVEMDDEDDMSMYHHGWGAGFRNSLGLWGDTELSQAFKEIGIWHADDMSSILLESIWRRVHNQELNMEEQVGFYKVYWLENKTLLDEVCPECSETLNWRQSFPLAYVDQPNASIWDYRSPEFPKVGKTLQWYKCRNGHEYVRTSESGFAKPQQKHLDARKRVDEAESEKRDPFGNRIIEQD